MKIADVIIQSILMLAALVSLSLGKEALVWIAIIQFLVGAWQLLSAIVHSFHMHTAYKKKMMVCYWISVAVYFAVLVLITMLEHTSLLAPWFFCAWIIAIYYYILTVRFAFDNVNGKRSFLDVAN